MADKSCTEFEAQLNRLKEAAGVTSDTELARVLNKKQGSISNAKLRKKIPQNWFVTISNTFGVYLGWLMQGTGPMKSEPAPKMIEHYVRPLVCEHIQPQPEAGEFRQNIGRVSRQQAGCVQCLALYARLDQLHERLHESIQENAILKVENSKLRIELEAFKNEQYAERNIPNASSAS